MRVGLVQAVADDTDHHLVWDQLTTVHEAAGLTAEASLGEALRPQDLAGGDCRDLIRECQALGLGALSAAGRAEKHQVHGIA